MVFEHESERTAAGRTPSAREAVEAAWCWLDNASLDTLYGRFEFVDWQKRELARIRDSVMEKFPDLRAVAGDEKTDSSNALSSLWFRTETRSAHLHFSGRNHLLQVICHWDQCTLFSFTADDWSALAALRRWLRGDDWTTLGAVLKRWLCDNAAPSTMRKEFRWLEIGKLADFYENSNPVEGEFIVSWDQIEQFYARNPHDKSARVPRLIAELRRAGFDRKLRAGQSMWTFLLSRSRRHGLRPEQPCIRFEFNFREGTMDVVSSGPKKKHIRGITIAMSTRIEQALVSLASEPIT